MKKSLFILVIIVSLISPLSSQAKSKKSFWVKPTPVQNNFHESIEHLNKDYKGSIKAIFADVEDVLAIKSANQYTISEATKQTVKDLKEINFPLILMTDKSVEHAKNVADQMGIRDSYIVANNGAIIADEYNSVFFINGIKKNNLDKILNDAKSFSNYYKIKPVSFFYTRNKLYTFKENAKLPYISDEATVIKKTDDLGKDYVVTQVSFYEPNARTFRALKRQLTKRFSNDFNIYTSENCYINITSKTVSKENAIISLCKRFGYNLNEIAIVGNRVDNIGALRLVKNNEGLPITFSSAPEEVKEASDFTIETDNNNTFETAARAIIEHNKKIKDSKVIETIEF